MTRPLSPGHSANEMKPACTWDSHADFEKLIGPLREVARGKGYAIGVHGSLVRDIDLIACAWTRDCASPKELATAIRAKIVEINGAVFDNPCEANKHYFKNGRPGEKPHGRIGWVFHLTDQLCLGPYVDMSVMPPRTREQDDAEFDRYVEEHRNET